MSQNNDLEDFIIKLREDEGDIGKLRGRAMYEDGILNSRTNIVLVFNAILAAAVNIASSGNGNVYAEFGIAGFALLFNILWLPCALKHGSYLDLISKIIRDSDCVPVDEKLRFKHQEKEARWYKPKRYGPTKFMTKVMPFLLAAGWFVWTLCILAKVVSK